MGWGKRQSRKNGSHVWKNKQKCRFRSKFAPPRRKTPQTPARKTFVMVAKPPCRHGGGLLAEPEAGRHGRKASPHGFGFGPIHPSALVMLLFEDLGGVPSCLQGYPRPCPSSGLPRACLGSGAGEGLQALGSDPSPDILKKTLGPRGRARARTWLPRPRGEDREGWAHQPEQAFKRKASSGFVRAVPGGCLQDLKGIWKCVCEPFPDSSPKAFCI